MKCKICGTEIDKSEYYNEVLCSRECFNKNFWCNIINNKDKYIIVDGTCYSNGNALKNHTKCLSGYDGRTVKVKFFDGRTETTNNLRCHGDIPFGYREFLQDNAEFILN